MENTHENENQQPETLLPEEEAYSPRPAWQVWAARIGLVFFILFLIYQYLGLLRGGV